MNPVHQFIKKDKYSKGYSAEELMSMTDEQLLPPPISQYRRQKKAKELSGAEEPHGFPFKDTIPHSENWGRKRKNWWNI